MVPISETAAAAAASGELYQHLELPAILPLDLSQQLWTPRSAVAGAGGGGAGRPAAAAAEGVPEVVFRVAKQGCDGCSSSSGPIAIRVFAGGQAPLTVEAVASGSFEIVPGPMATAGDAAIARSAGHVALTAGGNLPAGLAGTAVSSGGGSSPNTAAAAAAAAAGIARKIGEVESKVAAVAARWGPLSLKTSRAYFLLHHACRHPAAESLFQAKGEEALRR